MSENIYQAPQADLTVTLQQKGSLIKAIVIATIIDIVGTFLLGMAIGVVYMAILTSSGMPIEEVATTVEKETRDVFSTLTIIGVVLGGMVTLFAGYTCAKIANYSEYKVVSYFGVITVSFSAFMGMGYYSLSENIVLGAVTLGCAYCGAWLYVRKKNANGS